MLTPGELGAAELDRWTEIQAADAELASPFLRPEFAAAVGRVRPATRVAVLADAAGVVGFLPFERRPLRSATALAMGLSDVQGLVAPRDAEIALHEVVRACGLRSFAFDHLLAGQERWLAGAVSRCVPERSPAVDVSGGFDAYVSRQRVESRSLIPSTARKRRKLEREQGPVRLVFDQRDGAALEQVLRWKSDQYRRTGRADRFAHHANRALVHELTERRHAAFGAPLSVLLAGDRIVAAHLGLRSATTLAWWFPVYDPAYARYSPGLVLCLELVRAMADEGLTLLDLGKGDEAYKDRLGNTHIDLLRGAVARDRLGARVHRARSWPRDELTRVVLESPRLRRQARATLAGLGRLRGVAGRSGGFLTSSGRTDGDRRHGG